MTEVRQARPAPRVADHPGRRAVSAATRRENRAGWLFIAPWLVGFVCFTGGPILATLGMSFSNWTITGSASWIGGRNYVRLVHDPVFWTALRVTTIYAAVSVPLSIVVALALAMLLHRPVRGIGIYRTIFYLPSVLPIASVAIIFRWFYNPDWGVLNYLLGVFHLPQPAWLASPHLALASLVVMSLWNVGIGMVIFLAGLQGISDELLEAASVDGAGHWSRFWHIVLPSLSPVLFFQIMTGLIAAMQIFVQPYLMTDGGPGDHTRFLLLYIYQTAFQFSDMGYASTLAWALFVYIAVLTLVTLRVSRRLTRTTEG